MRFLIISILTLLFLSSPLLSQTQTPGSVSQTSGALVPPIGSTTAPMVPGDSIQFVTHGGSNPLGLCIDEPTRTLYVCDMFTGTTHLYNIDDLSAGIVSTIPNPAGNVSTSGLDIDGDHIYWVIPGANQNLWRSLKDGSNPLVVGQLDLPGGGIVGDICITEDHTLWAVDVTHDQYSQHLLTGEFLGDIIGHPAGSGTGNSIAYRNDCNLLLIPHNLSGSNTVTKISTLDTSGHIRAVTDVSTIGGFINGVAHASIGSLGLPTVFLVDTSLNRIYEIESQPACPQPILSGQHEYQICGPTGVRPIHHSSVLTESIHFDQYGTVRDVNLYLEMEHEFVADIHASLTSPTGTTVTLFSETQYNGTLWGITFDQDGQGLIPDGPGSLDDFDGQETQGNWIFTVSDLYAGADGALYNWCLRIDEVTRRVHRADFPMLHQSGVSNQAISQGVPLNDAITIDSIVPVTDVNLDLNLMHGLLSDLSIKLLSPLGTEVTLVQQGPAYAGEIHTTFDQDAMAYAAANLPTAQPMQPQGPGSLNDLVGEMAQGDWLLSVTDSVGSEDGILQNWTLSLQEPVLLNVSGSPLVYNVEVLDPLAIEDLEVALKLDHPSTDQLHITLTSPTGTTVILEQLGGHSGTSIDVIYDSSGIDHDETLASQGIRMKPASLFDPFLGESMAGHWILTVTDNLSSPDGWLTDLTLVIHGDDAPCEVPTVDATSSTVAADWLTPITFSGILGGSTATQIHWDFGDGSASPDLNTVHSYPVSGTYTVTLTVENPCGTAFTQFPVTICQPPVADFLLPGWIGIAPFCAEFANLSSGNIDHLTWSFGNGETIENNGDATYFYDTPGFYSITLEAHGSCGTISTQARINEVKVLNMGDINADGYLDTSDPISLVLYLFGSGLELACPKTGDVNGDQQLNLGDVVHQLIFLFGGGPESAPVNNCGDCNF
ncbi:MAG: proprotein convertase P-domain-containing protein [Planctomycetota bacterium]|nr:proprotein convertase P-domain-containing protein [Planctomycetota bacterium]